MKVGKRVGNRLYVHRSCSLEALVEAGVNCSSALSVQWDVLRVDKKNGEIALVHCHDFDTAPEPEIHCMTVCMPDLRVIRVWTPPKPVIYHQKELMVRPDYEGFDVEAARARTRRWKALDPPPDTHRIGYKEYWEREVLPRL